MQAPNTEAHHFSIRPLIENMVNALQGSDQDDYRPNECRDSAKERGIEQNERRVFYKNWTTTVQEYYLCTAISKRQSNYLSNLSSKTGSKTDSNTGHTLSNIIPCAFAVG